MDIPPKITAVENSLAHIKSLWETHFELWSEVDKEYFGTEDGKKNKQRLITKEDQLIKKEGQLIEQQILLLKQLQEGTSSARQQQLEVHQQGADTLQVNNEGQQQLLKRVEMLTLEFEMFQLQFEMFQLKQNTITEAAQLGKKTMNVAKLDPEHFQKFNISCTSNLFSVKEHSEKKLKLKGKVQRIMEEHVLKRMIDFCQSMKDLQFSVKDTSNKDYLKNPIAKIDISLLASTVSLWSCLISFIELKGFLSDQTFYDQAVGQIIDRATNLFLIQPERKFVYAAIAGCDSIEFFYVLKSKEVRRSGLLPLIGEHSIGMSCLTGFLKSSPSELGYVDLQLPETIAEFTVENVLQREPFVAQGKFGEDSTPLVLKSTADDNEMMILQALRNVSNVPEIVHYSEISGKHQLVMKPFGSHMEAQDNEASVRQIHKVFADVLKAIRNAKEKGILHRDVSYQNIIVSDGCGYLIDWHVASSIESCASSDSLTFNKVFASLNLLSSLHKREVHEYTVNDDLESLYWTYLFVATNGRVHFAKARDVIQTLEKKRSTITEQFFTRYMIPAFIPQAIALTTLYFNNCACNTFPNVDALLNFFEK